MPYSGISHVLALVRTDVSEERIAPIIRVTRIGDVGTNFSSISSQSASLVVTLNVTPSSPFPVTLMMEATRSSETSVLTKDRLKMLLRSRAVHRTNLKRRTKEVMPSPSARHITLIWHA
jgi:hypothetical protein